MWVELVFHSLLHQVRCKMHPSVKLDTPWSRFPCLGDAFGWTLCAGRLHIVRQVQPSKYITLGTQSQRFAFASPRSCINTVSCPQPTAANQHSRQVRMDKNAEGASLIWTPSCPLGLAKLPKTSCPQVDIDHTYTYTCYICQKCMYVVSPKRSAQWPDTSFCCALEKLGEGSSACECKIQGRCRRAAAKITKNTAMDFGK